MKKMVLITSLLLFYCFQSAAQSTEQIVVKAGDDIAAGFSPNGFFRFPEYMDGSFTLKDGTKSNARFNYNIVSGEMHFIGPNSDTMILSQPEIIDIIYVGNTPFVYNKGYIELVGHNDMVNLGKKITVRWQTESIGAYGMAAPTGSIDHFKQIIAGNSYHKLSLSQNFVFTKRISYWLIDKSNIAVQANRKNFLKLYTPDKQGNIEEYIKKNNVNFDKEDQLIQLIKQFPN